MNRYNKTDTSVYSLKAHIVLCTKYRYSIITEAFEDWLRLTVTNIGQLKGFSVVELKADGNHIHILVDYHLELSGRSIIKSIKEWTTKGAYRTWKDYMEKIFKGERYLWSEGSFICSTGQGSEEVVAEYIRNQGLK